MKIEELFVGAKVLWNGQPAIVHTVTDARQIRLSNSMELSELDYISNFDVMPIPVTEKLLRKFGFENDYSDHGSVIGYKFCGITVGLNMTANVGSRRIAVDGVHTIQYLLMLAGQHDVALKTEI